MPRPENVTHEDLARWSDKIDNDPFVSVGLVQNPIIREVCYAGQWLNEKLSELQCPDEIIGRIMYTAGTICFGRDPWEVHQDILQRYMNGALDFEDSEEIVS